MSNIIAIRSLQCKDHAYNIPPKVLTVNWSLTKRCNYDCGYCSSFVHDAVSPFVKVDYVRTLIENCKQWCGTDRKIKWTITGGEPFIDPNIIFVFELLHNQPYTEQVNTISNGSLPLEKYLEAAKFVAGITFSLHFERSAAEITKIINKIIAVKKKTNIMISVNIMFLPGLSTRVQTAIAKLKTHNIAYIVRLITPLDTEANKIKSYVNNGTGRKTIILKSTQEQTQLRQQFKSKNDMHALSNIQSYYSDDELLLIEQLNNKISWQNAGIWVDNGDYQEINTDLLVSSGKNNFKNWICYAGVDGIYIDWDGTIYRGACLNDGPIGHINKDNFITTTATKCNLNLCGCNVDIPIRKASNPKYLKLITS